MSQRSNELKTWKRTISELIQRLSPKAYNMLHELTDHQWRQVRERCGHFPSARAAGSVMDQIDYYQPQFIIEVAGGRIAQGDDLPLLLRILHADRDDVLGGHAVAWELVEGRGCYQVHSVLVRQDHFVEVAPTLPHVDVQDDGSDVDILTGHLPTADDVTTADVMAVVSQINTQRKEMSTPVADGQTPQ